MYKVGKILGIILRNLARLLYKLKGQIIQNICFYIYRGRSINHFIKYFMHVNVHVCPLFIIGRIGNLLDFNEISTTSFDP